MYLIPEKKKKKRTLPISYGPPRIQYAKKKKRKKQRRSEIK